MVSRDIFHEAGKSRRKPVRARDVRRALAELIRLYAPTVRRGLEVAAS